MIIRYAATSIAKRGALSCRATMNASLVSNRGGVQQGVLAPSPKLKAPLAVRQRFSTQSNDKRLEAIEKSEQLHAELKEVDTMCDSTQVDILIVSIVFFTTYHPLLPHR